MDRQLRRVRRNCRRLQRMGLTVERLTRRVESREHNSSLSDGVSQLKSGLGERIRLRNLLPLTELMKSARSVLRSRVFHYDIDVSSMLKLLPGFAGWRIHYPIELPDRNLRRIRCATDHAVGRVLLSTRFSIGCG